MGGTGFFGFCHVFVIFPNREKQNKSQNHRLVRALKIFPDVIKDSTGHSSVVITL